MTRTQRIATAVLAFSALAVAALPTLAVGQDSSLLETRRLAEQGNALAQYNLGAMYANGAGVPENYVLAYAWYNLAAAQGHETAVSGKANLQPHMTAAQIAEAQELSTTLFARINGGG